MPLHTETHMPEGLEEFPWKHLLHMWMYDGFRGNLRLTLWYPHEDDTMLTQAEDAFSLHLDVWSWLEEHAGVEDMPSFDLQGSAYVADGVQRYARVECTGTFSIGRPKPRPC